MSDHHVVAEAAEFAELCNRLAKAPRIAFDTEFVPEYSYAPLLCLLQVATDAEVAVIDPLAIEDLTPFWRAVLRDGCELVVHAGREELNFCVGHGGSVPKQFFDVQLAAGFAGFGYPVSHGNLVQRVLGAEVHSTETRTDWRDRPLSPKQIRYAKDDVRHLLEIRDRVAESLNRSKRTAWFEEETQRALRQAEAGPPAERWRRLGGAGGLSTRQLAVLKELHEWRDARARKLNKPTRWILRDDLLVELARRQPASVNDLGKTRGLGEVAKARWAPDVIEAVARGLATPTPPAPERSRRREEPEEQMVLKILSAALLHVSRAEGVAVGLLGTTEDLQELFEWQRSGAKPEKAPRLARGWRASVCGDHLTSLLEGRRGMRIRSGPDGVELVFEA